VHREHFEKLRISRVVLQRRPRRLRTRQRLLRVHIQHRHVQPLRHHLLLNCPSRQVHREHFEKLGKRRVVLQQHLLAATLTSLFSLFPLSLLLLQPLLLERLLLLQHLQLGLDVSDRRAHRDCHRPPPLPDTVAAEMNAQTGQLLT